MTQEIADLVARIPEGFAETPWEPVKEDGAWAVKCASGEVVCTIAEWSDQVESADAHMLALAPELAAALRAQQEEIGRLREALIIMVDHEIDYMTINKLGDPEKQHRIKVARAVIAQQEAKP